MVFLYFYENSKEIFYYYGYTKGTDSVLNRLNKAANA